MKQIKFAKKWRDHVNETTVHEYSAGSAVVVSDATANRALKAKVLDGEPTNAPDPVKSDQAPE